MRVLITGATGTLGREIARLAIAAGHSVVGFSHSVKSSKFRDAGWVLGDLATGEGIRVAVSDVHAVVHAATDPRRPEAVDIEGTRRLVAAARAAHVRHFVQMSIVGIDDIPVRYYEARRAAEQIVMGAGLPYSILRATQFHELVDEQLRTLAAVPMVMPVPKDFVVQSVDVREVAARLVRCLDERPRGRLADFGGPHVLPAAEAAAVWMRVKHMRKPIVHVPVPGRLGRAFRAEKNTAPFGERGKVSWREWLLRRETVSPIDALGWKEYQPPADIRRVS